MSEPRNDDRTLANDAATGDRKAFEALVSRHYETIYRISFKWCGNRSDAEDITQNACIKLAHSIDSFHDEAAFTSWLYRLVINTAKDWQRRQTAHHRHQTKSITSSKPSAINQPNIDDAVYIQQVISEVHRLPSGEKEALLLVVSEGLTHREAANIIGCQESTISWRIHEARKKLNVLFEGGSL